MKKILSLLAVLTMVLGLAACGSIGTETDISQGTQPNSETETSVREEETSETDVTQSDSTGQVENTDTNETKILVAYFSRTGENYGVCWWYNRTKSREAHKSRVCTGLVLFI